MYQTTLGMWGAILQPSKRTSNSVAVPSTPSVTGHGKCVSYHPGPRKWWQGLYVGKLYLTEVTCSGVSNMERLPALEFQVAQPSAEPTRKPPAGQEANSDTFLTVCVLGDGRTSCQPSLVLEEGSKFRVVSAGDVSPDCEVHVVGNVKIPIEIGCDCRKK